MEKVLSFVKKMLPGKLFGFLRPAYHHSLALIGALFYRFPSRQLKVIGVTGTKGKSTVTELLSAIFEEAGWKTALSGTVRFKIGNESRRNLYKMSMPGRFFMQKFLREAVAAGCDVAVIEMTSEGAAQFRHRFIDLDALVFINLAPEHIESHGSYEKYREAKLSIARALGQSPKLPKFMVANAADKEAARFWEAAGSAGAIPFSLADAKPFAASPDGSYFTWRGMAIKTNLPGEFNIANMVAAAETAAAFGIPAETVKAALQKFSGVPGRVQEIKAGQPFKVIVDYAHTPDSLTALYEAFPNQKKICVLGNTGGGRDTWKRPEMARIADHYCDEIILTNEDPYDEDPKKIIEEMASAIKNHTPKIIMDRREAIAVALGGAVPGDVVLITGKGTDPYIMEANGKKTPWDDATVVREELEKTLTGRVAG